MASPSMESFCCSSSENHPSVQWLLHLNFTPYNVVCIISSIIGILGAIYQILPYTEEGHTRRHFLSSKRQRGILTGLAFADMMASTGILVRSATWLSENDTVPVLINDNGSMFCAVTSGWIHYFYMATYFWTVCYALDVYLATKQKEFNPLFYHLISWGGSSIMTAIGLITLYAPDFKCHVKHVNVIVNYIFTYLPIVFVMIINPILYILASKQVKYLLTSYLGQFSDHERKMLAVLRERFIFIVMVFFCCWLPNILSFIILWSTWYELQVGVIVALLYMMAVLNPLQALLNSLVYRGWRLCGSTIYNLFCSTSLTATIPPESSEITPVLESSPLFH